VKPFPKTWNRWLATSIVFLILFLIVTVLVVYRVSQAFDASYSLIINNTSLGSGLTTVMVLASEYGREYFWVPIVAFMLVFGKRDTKMLAVELAALFVVGILAGEVIKLIIFRERPFETLGPRIILRVPPDTDSSYPSGHALIVSIGAIFSLAKFRKKIVASLFTIEAGIVCFSRIYVGMHYPLDVVSGIFLGGLIVFAGLLVLEKYLNRYLAALTDTLSKAFRWAFFSI
jgi:undecaprenyl-diphosphatase